VTFSSLDNFLGWLEAHGGGGGGGASFPVQVFRNQSTNTPSLE